MTHKLSIGELAVVDAYLASFSPADSYDPEKHILLDTQSMVLEMTPMCDIDPNFLADHLAEKGFRPHFIPDDGISGWIFATNVRHGEQQ